MADIDGGSGADTLAGTPGDDVIRGHAGADTLTGAAGNDHLEGGDQDDVLNGGVGHDGLIGGAGSDTLVDADDGNDHLIGGAGNDSLSFYRFSNLVPAASAHLDGGDDDDTIFVSASTQQVHDVTVLGGGGNDGISIHGGVRAVIDAGSGADRITIDPAGPAHSVTLGLGADVLHFYAYSDYFPPMASITIADFAVGDAGDRIDLLHYMAAKLRGWDPGTNPFGNGYLQLVQRGADTVLRIDIDAAAGPAGFTDFILFRNVTAGALTQFNLGGYLGEGSPLPTRTFVGTAGMDTLQGTGGIDLIQGMGSNDHLYGGGGDDRLEGGAGTDVLDGEFGSDLLLGGDAYDVLRDERGGNDELFGEAGDDLVMIARSTGAATTVLTDGGDGGDRLSFFSRGRFLDMVTMDGGIGDDIFDVEGGAVVEIDGGGGQDRVVLDIGRTAFTVTLGTEVDLVRLDSLEGAYSPLGTVTLTDFQAGDAGESIEWLPYLSTTLVGWDPGTNPFALGYLQLVQRGSSAVIRIDPNGTAGGATFNDLIVFRDVASSALTARNLSRYAPDGSAVVGDTLIGTPGEDRISGTPGADLIQGLAGFNTLLGGAGDDRIEGGADIDLIWTEFGNDVAYGGGGRDQLIDSATGNDRLFGGDGNDSLSISRSGSTAAGTFLLDGGNDDDALGYIRDDGFARDTITMLGGDGDDDIAIRNDPIATIDAGNGADTIFLEYGGDHRITLGAGADVLTLYGWGGSPNTGSIVITDFDASAAGDTLDLLSFSKSGSAAGTASQTHFSSATSSSASAAPTQSCASIMTAPAAARISET